MTNSAKAFLFATSLLLLCFVSACQSSDPGQTTPYRGLEASQLDSILCAQMTTLARLESHRIDQEKLSELIAAGADPNCSCELQWRKDDILSAIGLTKTREFTWTEQPIVVAFVKGDLQTIKTLVEHGAELDNSYILLNSDIEIWEYMFEQGVPISNYGELENVQGGIFKEQVKFLADHSYPIDSISSEDGTQLLQQVILSRKYVDSGFEKISYLISVGADPNFVNATDSTTALGIACTANNGDSHLQTITVLCQNGADVNQLSRGVQKTPLQIVSYHSNPKSIRVLLESGADVNSTENGTSALYTAVKAKQLKNVKVLLEFGANVNLKEPDQKFKTPLDLAIKTAHHSDDAAEIAKLLQQLK